MKEATIINEFKQTYGRIDELADGMNIMTDHVSGLLLRCRAHDNLINRSWILSRFISHRRVVKEMVRINEDEIYIRKEEARIKARNAREADLARKQQEMADAKEEEIDNREKKLNRQIRKGKK